MTDEIGTVTMYPKLERREWIFGTAPDPRDARIAELEAQLAKARQLPQQIMDAIEQYDFDGERWFIADIRAIVEGKAGYPCDDDSLWFTGAEWQGLLDTAIGGECAQRDARIAELEAALREIEHWCEIAIVPYLTLKAIRERANAALVPPPESDMTITQEAMDA